MNPMKHIIVLLTVAAVGCGAGIAFAHGLAQLSSELPSPGLTPSSPFYFLDRLGETIQEFFTFSPEGKAKLQVEFANERIAELHVTLEVRGSKDPGVDVALERLHENIAKANDILEEEKLNGKDVTETEEFVDNGFEEAKNELENIFNDQMESLDMKESELEDSLQQAVEIGDKDKSEELSKELSDIKSERESLEAKEEEGTANDQSLEEELDSIDKLEKEIQGVDK